MKHNTIELDGKTFAVLPLEDLEHLEKTAQAALEEQADSTSVRAGLAEMAARHEDLLTSEEVLRLADTGPVKFWRERRAMKAVDLARKAEISPAYLSEIETGKKPGTIDVMKRLAAILCVTLDNLAG